MLPSAYLKIKGQRQGQFKGSVAIINREDTIEVIAASHDLLAPRDPFTGEASGKRLHKPFIITKILDKSSPLFYAAFAANENIIEFQLDFYNFRSDGSEEKQYTVVLKDASISSIHFEKPNCKHSEVGNHPMQEIIAFSYQSIEWIWIDGNIVANDEWATPK